MALPSLMAGGRRRYLVRLVVNGFGQAGAAIATALLVRHGFDALIVTSGPSFARDLAIVGLGLLITAALAAWLRKQERVDAERLGQGYVHSVRRILFRHLTELDRRTLRRRSRGALMLRFIGDLSAQRQWISIGIGRLVVSGLTAVLAVAALAVIDLPIGVAVGVAVLTAGGIAALMGPGLREVTRAARRRRARLAALLNEKIAAVAVIQAFGETRRERRRVARYSARLTEAMVARAVVTGWLRAVSEGISALAVTGALIVGAFEVAGGRAGPGSVVAAMVVAGILAPRLRDLGRVYEYWNAAQVARQKLEAFLAMRRMNKPIRGSADLATGPGRLQFRSVTVDGILDRVTAAAGPGARIAIVGSNGAGKSALLAVAAGLLKPTGGRVVLDGQDIFKIPSGSIRRAFSIAGPDLPLMRGSLDDNLRYGGRHVSEDEFTDILALCGVDRIVAELPEGLQTRLSDGADNLSVGQRNRVALARALLSRPRVLLLDEIEAHLDRQAAAAVDRVLDRFEGTILMVTHDRRLAARANSVWHLEGGRLVDDGEPSVVFAGDGPAARLFRPRIAEVA